MNLFWTSWTSFESNQPLLNLMNEPLLNLINLFGTLWTSLESILSNFFPICPHCQFCPYFQFPCATIVRSKIEKDYAKCNCSHQAKLDSPAVKVNNLGKKLFFWEYFISWLMRGQSLGLVSSADDPPTFFLHDEKIIIRHTWFLMKIWHHQIKTLTLVKILFSTLVNYKVWTFWMVLRSRMKI